MDLSLTELSYLGGLFDAEGSINIISPKHSVTGTRQTLVQVSLGNTHYPTIMRLNGIVPGHLFEAKAKPNCKPCWQYELRYKAAREFMEMIRPYLRIKRRQADLVVDHDNFVRDHNVTSKRQPSEEWAMIRAGYVAQLVALHKETFTETERTEVNEWVANYNFDTLTEEDKSYIAGVFDGEGSVCITEEARGRYGSAATKVKCNVANTDYRVAAYFRQLFGGGITHRPAQRETQRDWYVWQSSAAKADTFFSTIAPYSFIKKPQIDVALAHAQWIKDNPWRKPTQPPESYRAQRHFFKTEIDRLKTL